MFPLPETVAAKYPWYYLNTYVTNTIDGRVYVVDGQQRLTTLTLILILTHLLQVPFTLTIISTPVPDPDPVPAPAQVLFRAKTGTLKSVWRFVDFAEFCVTFATVNKQVGR